MQGKGKGPLPLHSIPKPNNKTKVVYTEDWTHPVTQLRKKMLEELQRRNYSHRTAKTYIRIVREFAEHFHQSPDKLGPEQIRQYQAHLFQTKKLAPATVSQYVSALRFLFVKTLRRHYLAEYIPFPKCSRRLCSAPKRWPS